MKNRYEHEYCQHCVFLGIDNEFDLYFCSQGDLLPTIIARFGNNGSDYYSGIVEKQRSYRPAEFALLKGKKMALEKGLLTTFDEHLLEELKDQEVANHYILYAMDEPYFIKTIKQVSKVHGKKFVINVISQLIEKMISESP